MHALPLFSEIVEDYKLYLREDLNSHQSFSKFIQPYRVRYKSLTQWMRRHGLSILQLQYDVLLEKCGTHREEVIAQLADSIKSETPPVAVRGSGKLPDDKLLSKVNINFPDGLHVSINAASPTALYDFINRYNHLLDKQDVRIG